MKDNLVWSQRFVQNMRLRGQVTLMRSRKNDLKNSWALCRRWVESPCATTLVVGNQAIKSNTTHQNFLMKIGTSRKQTLLVSKLILSLIILHCFQSHHSRPLDEWFVLHVHFIIMCYACWAVCKRLQHCWPTAPSIVVCSMLRPFAHPDCAKFETGKPFSPVQTYATLLGVVASVCK